MWVGGGENQIYCMAQVQIFEFWVSWAGPDPHLTLTWPGPGPELDKIAQDHKNLDILLKWWNFKVGTNVYSIQFH